MEAHQKIECRHKIYEDPSQISVAVTLCSFSLSFALSAKIENLGEINQCSGLCFQQIQYDRQSPFRESYEKKQVNGAPHYQGVYSKMLLYRIGSFELSVCEAICSNIKGIRVNLKKMRYNVRARYNLIFNMDSPIFDIAYIFVAMNRHR